MSSSKAEMNLEKRVYNAALIRFCTNGCLNSQRKLCPSGRRDSKARGTRWAPKWVIPGRAQDAPLEVPMTDRPQPHWTCPRMQELKNQKPSGGWVRKWQLRRCWGRVYWKLNRFFGPASFTCTREHCKRLQVGHQYLLQILFLPRRGSQGPQSRCRSQSTQFISLKMLSAEYITPLGEWSKVGTQRAEEHILCVQRWLYKHEDLSWEPKHPHQSWLWGCVPVIPAPGGRDRRILKGSLSNQPV